MTSRVIQITDTNIQPCRVTCSSYCATNNYECSINDDVNNILLQMIQADVVIIGTPLYFRAPPAKFHTLIERLISIFFFKESQGIGQEKSPLQGKPCGLIGVAEYSNPHQVLEYLHDFCMLLHMNPVRIQRFPYLGVAGQGNVKQDVIFKPFERAKELAESIVCELTNNSR